MRVFDEFFLCEHIDKGTNRAGADDGKKNASRAFDQRMRPLEKYADDKDLMYPVLVHSISKADRWQTVWDQAITTWINASAGTSTFADLVMVSITRLGVPFLVLLVALQWWPKRNRNHMRHACIAAGITFFIGLGINQLLLLFVHRIRPYDAGLTYLTIAPSNDWSFPSDHATAAFGVATAFGLNDLPGRAFVLFVMAFMIGWSRIFVGTHYLTDVLGGAATGICTAVLVRVAYREGSRLDLLATRIL